MILLHVITSDEKIAEEISQILLMEKMLISATILPKVSTLYVQEGRVIKKEEYLILGKTKAFLFDPIDKLIRKKYPNDIPMIYSVPIVNMNWQLSEILNNNVYEI